ncbi:MAG TPA: aspartate kinase [Dongiaceae bacterium]|nr:aspartate kinase [Dongiaceae bacterium]
MIVMKFGGTSVAGAGPMRKVGGIVRRFAAKRPIVVVSALAGVTDDLLAAGRAAAAGRHAMALRRAAALEARHAESAAGLGLAPAVAARLARECAAEFAELREVLHGMVLLREPGPRPLDLLASFGERLSARLVAAHLASLGLSARYVDARDAVLTDDAHGAANVEPGPTGRRLRARLGPLLRARVVPVVTGFIGRDAQGATTTLGRSGSDYTAALVAEALRARELWIWKEVDGVLTADPDLVPEARLVARLSYAEAAEMSHFGAEVLHPKTMQPARRAGVPVRIKNTFRPQGAGTVIGRQAGRRGGPLMVSCLDRMALVTIEGAGIFGQPGMVLRLLAPVAGAGTNIYMISMSSSEYNISFAVHGRDVARTRHALERDFRARGWLRDDVARVTIEPDMAVVAVVGAGMKGQRGIAGRIFSALGDRGVNVVAIAQGSSEYNISIVVRRRDRRAAVRAIHARLNRGGRRSGR